MSVRRWILAASLFGSVGYGLAWLLARNAVARFEQLDPESAGAAGSFVDVDGVRLHYVERGQGQPVVLIHGLSGSTFSYRFAIPALSERYRVVALDLKGFGYSARPADGDYSLTAQAELVRGLMDRLGIERATVVGHSMGGAIAMRLALAAPERVLRLILADSVVDFSLMGPARFGSVMGPLFPLLYVFTSERPKLVERAMRITVHDPDYLTPDVVEGYTRPLRVKGTLRALRMLMTSRRRDESLDVERIAQPTLVLWGEDDRVFPLGQGEALTRRLPNARLEVIPRAGHLSLEERPEEFNRAIIAFLAEAESGATASPSAERSAPAE